MGWFVPLSLPFLPPSTFLGSLSWPFLPLWVDDLLDGDHLVVYAADGGGGAQQLWPVFRVGVMGTNVEATAAWLCACSSLGLTQASQV